MGKLNICALVSILLLAACGNNSSDDNGVYQLADRDREAFFLNLQELCGQSFWGRLVSDDEVDATFGGSEMVMHVRDCESEVVRIPFHVDDNRSRTWVVTKTDDSLTLQHDHRHEDGVSDKVSLYGGKTLNAGDEVRSGNTETIQKFPADDFSKALFIAEGLEISVDNIWSIEIQPGKIFAYELRRPNRHFRVEFDLSSSVATPPPAWGYNAADNVVRPTSAAH